MTNRVPTSGHATFDEAARAILRILDDGRWHKRTAEIGHWRRGFRTQCSKTCLTVAAYHSLPPCAVGTPASFRSAAIFRYESPRARWRWIRRTTALGTVGGRPRRTPLAFFAASASRVRCPISLRESGEHVHHRLARGC